MPFILSNGVNDEMICTNLFNFQKKNIPSMEKMDNFKRRECFVSQIHNLFAEMMNKISMKGDGALGGCFLGYTFSQKTILVLPEKLQTLGVIPVL